MHTLLQTECVNTEGGGIGTALGILRAIGDYAFSFACFISKFWFGFELSSFKYDFCFDSLVIDAVLLDYNCLL